ncbi:hypothetical protein EC912_101310 [Luteibacter rhizovicinus]|uniref:Uncharacterized protein n=1 Tax=Luteibacter rhizovicinus TaxID=242606 RepID=A0A4R3YXF6_9GAMM|nr:hypothetical protein [Luteibacter rhizovicinus]TCV97310.1 hypothetical protein EC912_101310 [Luteibacter rhizovicinus]
MSSSFVKLFALALLVASGVACSRDESGKDADAAANVPPSGSSVGQPPKPVVPDENAAVQRVEASIAKNKLSALKPECLSYIPYASDAQGFIVDVHELHNEACGGDPSVAPRLFSFNVDKVSGRMTTDASDPAEGLFHAID